MKPNSDNDSSPKSENPQTIRWLVLLTYSSFSLTNEANWLTFSSILTKSSEFYDEPIENIVWFSTNYFIIYIIFSFLGSWMIYKCFALSMFLGTFLNALGCWIRYFANKNYALSMFGQCLIAFASIWALETPIVLSEAWFPKKERFFSLSVGIYSNPIGAGLSYIFSAWIIQTENSPEKVSELLLLSAIITSFPFVIFCLLIPGIKVKKDQIFINKSDFHKSMKKLMKDKKYMVSMFFFAFSKHPPILCCYKIRLAMGHIWSIESLLDLILASQSLSTLEVGLTGLIMVFAGVLSGFLASLILLKPAQKIQDILIKALMTISLLSLILICFFVKKNLALVNFLFGLLGFGILGVIPLICDSLAEISFPVEETLSNNTWFVMVNFIALIETTILSMESLEEYRMIIFTVVFTIPWFFSVLFYKTEFKKSQKKENQTIF